MSQVKNLRAMFEQKHDTSPPDKAASDDRGRSPAESSTGASTPPARPLSKVRTSFVAVQEKDGRVGLRRDPSSDSVPTNRSTSQHRRLSANTEEGSASALSDKGHMATAPEPIPESPRPAVSKANGTNGDVPANLGAVTDAPSRNPDKQVDEETSTPKLRPADPTEKPPAPSPAPAKDTSKTAKPASREPPKSAHKALAKPEPVPIKSAAKAPAKSPSLTKKPSNIIKSASGPLPTRPAREPNREPTKKAAPAPRPSTTSTRTATKPTASSATKVAAPSAVKIPTSSSTGFVKPKVKSPTRPVNLPSSLMAGTASSQSKIKDGSRESLSAPRTSTSRQSVGRSPSRASVSTAGGTTAGTKTAKRQNSTINHSRPSLGPPPKKPAQNHPVAKTERDVDEGFLARMARPTLSSASKVNDKAPVTPPRKGATSTTRASSTATSARRAPRPSSAAQAATGSPGPQSTTSQKPDAAEGEAEPSAIEKAEVEEALREATKIPEVAEPVEPVLVRAAAPPPEAVDAPKEVDSQQPEKDKPVIGEPVVEEPTAEISAAETEPEARTKAEDKEIEPTPLAPAVEAAAVEQENAPETIEEAQVVEPAKIEEDFAAAEQAQPEGKSELHEQPVEDNEPASVADVQEEPNDATVVEEMDRPADETAPEAHQAETKVDDSIVAPLETTETTQSQEVKPKVEAKLEPSLKAE